MRKILYLIIASIYLTSCWVQEYNEISKTYYAYQNYNDVEFSLKYATSMICSAEKINMWLVASEQDKKLIEDAYFSNYEIHQKGNVVTVTSTSKYGNPANNRVYNTGGKGLYDIDSHWILATLSDTVDIKCIGEKQLQSISRGEITIDNYYYKSNTNMYDLILTKFDSDQYTIKGAGCVHYMSRGTEYRITDDIVVKTDIKHIESAQYSISVMKGEIEYSWENREDKAQAKILSRGKYVISYKGFTDNWPQ